MRNLHLKALFVAESLVYPALGRRSLYLSSCSQVWQHCFYFPSMASVGTFSDSIVRVGYIFGSDSNDWLATISTATFKVMGD